MGGKRVDPSVLHLENTKRHLQRVTFLSVRAAIPPEAETELAALSMVFSMKHLDHPLSMKTPLVWGR